MSAQSTKDQGPLSMKDLAPSSRNSADERREIAERKAMATVNGHARRRVGRDTPITLRTFAETKIKMNNLADFYGKSYVELIEMLIDKEDAEIKGKK